MSTDTATPAHRRHDIPDRVWETIAPHLSGGPGKVGRHADDSRRFSNAVFWIRRDLARPVPRLWALEHYPPPLRTPAAGRTLSPPAVRST